MKEKEEIPDWCYDIIEKIIEELDGRKGIDISGFDVDIRIDIENTLSKLLYEELDKREILI